MSNNKVSSNDHGMLLADDGLKPLMMVHVTAPASLPAGYTFEAEINGDPNKVFTCEVVCMKYVCVASHLLVSDLLHAFLSLTHKKQNKTHTHSSPKRAWKKDRFSWPHCLPPTRVPALWPPRAIGRMDFCWTPSMPAVAMRHSGAVSAAPKSPWHKSWCACNYRGSDNPVPCIIPANHTWSY
jgi:hypothetical protein